MAGLIDHIFENIVIKQLTRTDIADYVRYISEILQQNLTLDQKVRYQQLKVQLNQRLRTLNQEEFTEILRPIHKTKD
ncbi:hypothetical protein AHMF7605_29090 [Adhaeribacter arboris]|uniref:IDEAL domain-containing protein n=1 Tax=Adhaeribacter arboris TaxID=2072846 RepID=A0A2T2Y8Z3_9BACT|nr:hypothetical protein [Adhaeribacter arboris]PSR51966.1 hypothetical protein AHMF7605_29090 [Adhaeribacter arboris]